MVDPPVVGKAAGSVWRTGSPVTMNTLSTSAADTEQSVLGRSAAESLVGGVRRVSGLPVAVGPERRRTGTPRWVIFGICAGPQNRIGNDFAALW
jgi:hypothetical protein